MQQKNKKGFSIIELLISIFVLAIGILGVLALYARTLGPSFANRDEIIASGLAQEGIELVRNVRDTSILEHSEDENPQEFAFDDLSNGECRIDYNDDSCSGANYALKMNNFYNHDSGSPTKFSRKINISGDDNQKDIEVFVWWGDSSAATSGNCISSKKCISAKTILTKGSWQKKTEAAAPAEE